MKNNYILILFFLFSYSYSIAQDCNGRYQTNIYTDVEVTTVKYGEAVNASGNNQELFLDIYQAEGDTAVNRPLVIFAFGGSFVGGSRESAELVHIATDLAKKGYVCASIDYRLASSVVNLIQEEVLVKTVFRAIQDGSAAVRFFRKDADTDNEYKINPDQIFMGGTSAGGILAINLAYVDDLNKLTPQWREWAKDIGGLQGNSGNSGYCNYVQGVFGFAGAVADTNYIDENSVPFYGSHATEDNTVQYGFGPPLQGFAPADLYGSGLIDVRMNNLGLYSELDTYAGGDHPPLAGSSQILEETTENLASFLYNILDCNPNNQLSGNEISCDDFEEDTPNSIYFAKDFSINLFPNPTNDFFNIEILDINIDNAIIYNISGQQVLSISQNELNSRKVNVSYLNSGVYFIEFSNAYQKETRKLTIY